MCAFICGKAEFFTYPVSRAVQNIYRQSTNKYSDDRDVCRSYLDKANDSFDRFFEQSAFENKLLREDPTVAQCAFEYIAMLESKERNGCLTVSGESKRRLIGEKLDMAVRSSSLLPEMIT